MLRSKKTTPISSPSTSFNPPSDVENSPIDQVALTVSVTDDPSIPVLTFRMWLLGSFSCVLLAFLNQFFGYRTQPLSITSVSAQIAVMPLGHFIALTITDRVFFKGRWCEFTLNPGPFNVKEHVLIAIFANSGTATVFAIDIVNAVRIFYRKNLTFFVSLLVVLTTALMIGLGGWKMVDSGVRMGRNISTVSGGAGGDVVAAEPRAGVFV
ncbi:OPT superfamily [Asimina triloba]